MHESIIKTLAYSNIFDYPLTVHEIWRYLIEARVRDRVRIENDLVEILKLNLVKKKDDFYFLKSRDKIVELRKEKKEWSKEKWTIATKTAEKLKIIPTIKMIGVTGALAMNNCPKNDDIDLIIITGANSLWLTRLLIIFLCPFLGIKRRKRGEREVKDKICFNLFLEENHLKIKPENLFLAHEVCQVKPLVDKDSTYQKFLEENKWVKKYLPNGLDSIGYKVQNTKEKLLITNLLNYLISVLNKLAFFIQYQYMKPKMTVERVNLHQAFFHPGNLNDKIQKEFESGLLLL